jgi:hypothetical protein
MEPEGRQTALEILERCGVGFVARRIGGIPGG